MSVISRARRLGSSIFVPAAFSLAAYFVMSLIAVQPDYHLAAPLPDKGFMSGGGPFAVVSRSIGISGMSRESLAVLYFCMLAVVFLAYAWAIYLLLKHKATASNTLIIAAGGLFCAMLLFLPAILARDVYNYMFYGRAVSMYGRNPYLVPPSAFARDPGFALIEPFWRDTVSVYGPLFTLVSAGLTAVTRYNVYAATIAFKLLMFAFYIGSLALVADLARKYFPGKSSALLLSAAWSPMVVIYLVGGAHNDLMMIFFVLLGFVFYRRLYPALAVLSLVLAFLVKSTALLFLAPLLVLFLRDNARWRIADYARAGAAGLAAAVIAYVPVWPGLSGVRKIVSVGTMFSGQSIPTLIRAGMGRALISAGLGEVTATDFSTTATRALFVCLFLGLFALCCWRVRDLRSLLLYSGLIATAFAFTTTWLMPWYLGTAVFLLALSGSFTLIGTMTAATFFISFYSDWINPFNKSFVPYALLAVGLFLLVALIARGLPYRVDRRAVSA